uniref:RNA polymerase II associated protein 1 n=1 Tax=Anabas testudineus TaxID=64144 RepID=A0A7N5ZQL4_ANATE
MLRRPKPTDSEADLLREQEQFLVSGAPSAANVVRRPDKRRGEAGGEAGDQNRGSEGDQRDVVTIEDLPDQLPSLTPAPPKKSRFKGSRVTFEDDDAEERLDRHDIHISAVLSRIVERDTSSTPVNLPAFTGMAFPKVLHRSETGNQVPLSLNGGKKSIFARQIAAQRIKEGKTPLHCEPEAAQTAETVLLPNTHVLTLFSGPRLISGQGLAGPNSSGETTRIHRENQAKLQAMSESEIIEEQKKLLSQLDSRLVEFVRSRKAQSVLSSASSSKQPEGSFPLVNRDSDSSSAAALFQKPKEDLPVKPQKEWVHMDKLEPEKLEWMRDLPAPRRKGTKKAMQARFDFAGNLIPPTEDLPTHLGLHHHGEEPERAGYSLQELFLLSRSQVIQQRSLALSTLANILTKARAGEYLSVLKGSVMSTLLDAGLLFLLRFALDDSVEGVMSAAVHALKALLVCEEEEECLDCTFSWFRGLSTFPLLPSAQEEEDEEDEGLDESMKETAKEKEERKSDHEVARQDVVKGLLKMKLLPRLRYMLEVIRPSPRVVQDVLDVLTRIARHSSSSATQVLDCPRLMETVMCNFLPTSWSAPSLPQPHTVHGLPLASAMKLLRVLAASGRHACARLLNSLGVSERLSCLLSAEPRELLLDQTQALRITTEAYRLWTVAAAYGQACKLFIDLYPALVKTLQSVHQALAPSDPLLPLQLHRILALLSLLTQVTHTAGCHQELQAGMASTLSFFIFRSSSVVCNVQSSHLGPDSIPSLPGLACPGWRDRPGLVVPSSPFPLLSGLGLLLKTIMGIHKGLICKVWYILYMDGLDYSRWIITGLGALLDVVFFCHLVAVPIDPEVAKHASLYHQVALVLLPWLLPGSEYLAHELLSTIIFKLEELKLHEETQHHPFPSLQTVGTILREACIQLPSIRGCFLTHLAHLESSVLVSRDAFLGRNPWINSHLLPELTGPTLPSDWPFLPLVSLYERMGVSDGGGLAVEELPPGALPAVTHCLQWLLLLEIWREDALKVIPPVAKLARLSCMFLCSSDLFLERPVQNLIWGLFRLLTRPSKLDSLDLNIPPPGLASFQDLYSALLAQYEAVSFGDRLFGCWVLLPLQRRYSTAMRLAVFGEHVGMLRSLGVTLEQLGIPMERFTSPPEDSLPLLRLYFRSLVTGTLKHCWCPVLYVVALSHINSFIFSQDLGLPSYNKTHIYQVTFTVLCKSLRHHLLCSFMNDEHYLFLFF